jgi:YHS domain-containing protein
MQNLNVIRIIISLGLLSAFLIAGFAGDKTPSPGKAALAALAKADAADGKVDKIVSKCLMCMLGMDGKSENAATFGKYTLHFCSKTCKEKFLKDPEAAVLAVKFPAK